MAKVPLVDKPGVGNWVEKHNALPKGSWIRRAAEHLRGKGMPTGRAIATAVNAARRMCATGDTNWPGAQQVNPGSRAQACAAVAKWDAARAAARADTSIPAAERVAIELAFRSVDRQATELAEKKIPAASRKKAAGKGQTAYGTSFPIRNVDELRRAIAAYGRAPEAKRATVKRFILSRAKALGAMNLVPESWKRREMAEADLKAAVELAEQRGCEVKLARIELAAPRPGLVQVEVDVTSRKGTKFKRRVWVRPGQARAMAQAKGGQKVTAKGLETSRATRGVLEALAKIPRDQRPAGWDRVVKAIATGPSHGGRLGPEKRRALRDLQFNAQANPALRAAVTAALKADARVPAKPKPKPKPKAKPKRGKGKRATVRAA